MCEKFSAGKCLGCNGFEEDIDKVKYECEDYRHYMGIYKQIELEEKKYGK